MPSSNSPAAPPRRRWPRPSCASSPRTTPISTRPAPARAVAEAIVRELGWYDRYLERGHVARAANTTPGNQAGGLSNIVEKAMGSIIKSGTAPISHVLAPGEKLRPNQRGLVYAATPASDFICGTLQLP